MHMKKLLLPLIVALCVSGAGVSAYAQEANNMYGARQSSMEMERQRQEAQQNNAYNTYQQPFNFNLNNQNDDRDNSFVDEYSSKYKTHPLILKSEDEWYASQILPNYLYNIHFLRIPGERPTQTVLRIITPVAITGCLTMKNPTVKIQSYGQTMQLTLGETGIHLDRSVRYAHYQCDMHYKYAYVDVPLDRDQLIENGTKKITMKSAIGHLADIDLDVNEQRMTATVKNGGDILTHWFYPENTVVLIAPMAKMDETTRADITEAAKAHGLVPLSDRIASFDTDAYSKNALFFVDRSDNLSKKIDAAGKPVIFDTISVPDTYSGPNGSYTQPANIDVFARLPGLYE